MLWGLGLSNFYSNSNIMESLILSRILQADVLTRVQLHLFFPTRQILETSCISRTTHILLDTRFAKAVVLANIFWHWENILDIIFCVKLLFVFISESLITSTSNWEMGNFRTYDSNCGGRQFKFLFQHFCAVILHITCTSLISSVDLHCIAMF